MHYIHRLYHLGVSMSTVNMEVLCSFSVTEWKHCSWWTTEGKMTVNHMLFMPQVLKIQTVWQVSAFKIND